MKDRTEKLREYAQLLIRMGLNIQKGQTLVIASPVDCAWFARMCAEEAYAAGCREVVMNWRDDQLDRLRYLHADDAVFDEVPLWRRHFFNDYALEGAAYLSLAARDPEALRGVDPDRLTRANRAGSLALDTFYRQQMSNGIPWCIASLPIPAWARTVFPGIPEEEAMDKLWDAILEAVRIQGDGRAVERWQQHMETIQRRTEKLNELRLASLHYTNSLGTDLTIRLPEDHLWAGGGTNCKAGRGHPEGRHQRG